MAITNKERIIKLLHRQPGLDDDEISELTGIKPRQQVNQICRHFAKLGKLKRSQGPKGVKKTLSQAAEQGLHVLILSGGYGVLLADEPIGLYEAQLNAGCWPENLLEEVIASYARYHRLKYMRAFVSKSGTTVPLVKRVNWSEAGVDDAVLLVPECAGGSAMIKVPRAQGEAMVALVKGELNEGWRSSDGLALICKRLR